MAVRIAVREHGRLELPRDLDSPRMRERIIRSGRTDAGSAFRTTGRAIYARDLVGVVDAGPIQVEILPKITPTDADRDGSSLLRLLVRLGLPSGASTPTGAVGEDARGITEALIRGYAEELAALLLDGPPRRYSQRSELSTTIRGRVDLGRLAYQHPGTGHLVPIRHAPLQADNDLSRIVKTVVSILAGATRSGRTRELLERATRTLRDVEVVPLTPKLFRSVSLSRLEAEWDRIVELAKLLARRSAPDPVGVGSMPGFTLLFPLHGIFEQLIRRALRRRLSDHDIYLDRRKSAGNLLSDESGDEALHLKPDLVFRRREDNTSVLVGDVKWKEIDLSGPSFGIAAPDVYQINTYMARLELTRGLLLFPKLLSSSDVADGLLSLVHTTVLPDLGRLTVGEVDVAPLISMDREEREDAEVELASKIAALTAA